MVTFIFFLGVVYNLGIFSSWSKDAVRLESSEVLESKVAL